LHKGGSGDGLRNGEIHAAKDEKAMLVCPITGEPESKERCCVERREGASENTHDLTGAGGLCAGGTWGRKMNQWTGKAKPSPEKLIKARGATWRVRTGEGRAT